MTTFATVDNHRCYTLTVHVCANNQQSSVCVLTTHDDGGRSQVLSTSTNDCRLLITLGVQLCIQRDGRFGVRQRSAVHRR